ncbi:hypothetical protein ABGB12_21605 [Actinocorallia sp. B10E7]|uniref:hypothetical protein n=1 Tax=Actinocorallia sp. B10E7 TaxID=3153558 RepID=UPI00325F2339
MAIEQRPGTEDSGEERKSHLTGSPSIEAEWSGGASEELPRSVTLAGNPHGKVSSWAVVATAVVAFTVGGIAMILNAWVLFWVCVAVVLLMFPAAMAVRIMEDTVGWAKPTPGEITRGNMTRTAGRVRRERLQELKDAREAESEQQARR